MLITFNALPPSLVFAASLEGVEAEEVEVEGVEVGGVEVEGGPPLVNCYLLLVWNLEGDLDDCL